MLSHTHSVEFLLKSGGRDASGAGSAANPLGKPAPRARETLQFQPALVKRAYADSPREPTAPPSPQNKTISRRLSLSGVWSSHPSARCRGPVCRRRPLACRHRIAEANHDVLLAVSSGGAAASLHPAPSLPTHYISGQLTCNSRADRAPRIGSGISSLIS